MNNPFGIPDDLLSAMVAAAIKQQDQTKKNNLDNPFKVNFDVQREAEKSAKVSKALYDAYVKEGFTEAQAFEFTKNIITGKKN